MGRAKPVVGIIMGSDSDLHVMQEAAAALEEFGVPYELTIVSAHRTPDRLKEYAKSAVERGLRVIVAGAGGAAHLPGMVAASTPLPAPATRRGSPRPGDRAPPPGNRASLAVRASCGLSYREPIEVTAAPGFGGFDLVERVEVDPPNIRHRVAVQRRQLIEQRIRAIEAA